MKEEKRMEYETQRKYGRKEGKKNIVRYFIIPSIIFFEVRWSNVGAHA